MKTIEHKAEQTKSATRRSSLIPMFEQYVEVQEEKIKSERPVNPTVLKEMADSLVNFATRLEGVAEFAKHNGFQIDEMNWMVSLSKEEKQFAALQEDPEFETYRKRFESAGFLVIPPQEVEQGKAKLKSAGYKVAKLVDNLKTPVKKGRGGRPHGAKNRPKAILELVN